MALPDLKAVMEDDLSKISLEHRLELYTVDPRRYSVHGAAGTVFIDGSGFTSHVPAIYVEDRAV